MIEIFEWTMNAMVHRASVDALRSDLIDFVTKEKPVPISMITDLLPVDSGELSDAKGRGDIKITKGKAQDKGSVNAKFENRDDEELWMEFQDPVIRNFNLTVDQLFAGSAVADKKNDTLVVQFFPLLEFEIDRLSELGVARSAFQDLYELEMSPTASISKFRQHSKPDLETWIVAYLRRDKVKDDSMDVSFVSLSNAKVVTFDTAEGCPGGDPDDPNWYVVRRRQGGICFVHYSRVFYGGNNADAVFGPTTKKQCDNYMATRCPSSFC